MKEVIVLASLVVTAVFTAFSQSTLSSWSAVESIRAGTTVVIETKSGGTLKAQIASVEPDSVAVRQNGGTTSVPKADVYRVYLTRKGSVLKRAFWGAAAGAGIGVAVGAAITAATKSDGLAAAGGFLYGIPAGAAIGALSTGRKRGELIYQAN
jgi:hypothetical protein